MIYFNFDDIFELVIIIMWIIWMIFDNKLIIIVLNKMLRLKQKPITNSHNRTYLNESINLASSSKCSSNLSISP